MLVLIYHLVNFDVLSSDVKPTLMAADQITDKVDNHITDRYIYIFEDPLYTPTRLKVFEYFAILIFQLLDFAFFVLHLLFTLIMLEHLIVEPWQIYFHVFDEYFDLFLHDIDRDVDRDPSNITFRYHQWNIVLK